MENIIRLLKLLTIAVTMIFAAQPVSAAGFRGRCHSQNTGKDLGYVYSKTERGLTNECAGRATRPIVDNVSRLKCIPNDDAASCKIGNQADERVENYIVHFCVGKPSAGEALIEGGIAEADHIMGPKSPIGSSGVLVPNYLSDVEVDIYCKVWNSSNEVHWCTGPTGSQKDCFYGAHSNHSVERVTREGLRQTLVAVDFRNASHHEARYFQILAHVRFTNEPRKQSE